jgi:hypothetical protein
MFHHQCIHTLHTPLFQHLSTNTLHTTLYNINLNMTFQCPYKMFPHHSDDPIHLLRFTGSTVITFYCGAIDKIGSRPSHFRSPQITQNYAHPVGLIWTSVQLVSPANTSDQNIHALSGIRNHYPGNQIVSDLYLRHSRPPGLARCNYITYYVILMEGAIT